MSAVVTLDDLTAMMAADGHHRYEIGPEGVLSVLPPPGYAHAIIATRLMVWLATSGIPTDRIAQAVGLRIPGRNGEPGRPHAARLGPEHRAGGARPRLTPASPAQPVTR